MSSGRGRAPRGGDSGGEAATRKRELARIHLQAQALGLDRDQYEAVLAAVAGVASAALLDAVGRRRVIRHLASHLAARKLSTLPPDPDRPHNLAARPQLRKIGAQLAAAGRPWAYGRAVCERLYGKRQIEFADVRELSGVIAALAVDAERHGRDPRR